MRKEKQIKKIAEDLHTLELDYNFRRRTLDKRLEEVRENLTYAQLIVIEQLLKDCEEEKKP